MPGRERRVSRGPETGSVVQVRVLSSEGCANALPTVERLREVADELGVPIDLTLVVVATPEEAQALRFLGSPTVQLDGRDLEPAARGATGTGFS